MTVSAEWLTVAKETIHAVDQRVDVVCNTSYDGIVFSLAIKKLCRIEHHFIYDLQRQIPPSDGAQRCVCGM
jgi:hypothetical protein